MAQLISSGEKGRPCQTTEKSLPEKRFSVKLGDNTIPHEGMQNLWRKGLGSGRMKVKTAA